MDAFRGERIVIALRRAAPFFSFVIGLGLAALLFHRNFITIRTTAMPVKDIVDRIVKVDGKCVRYRVEDATCENSS
jgi:hypothetical protein